MNILLYLLILSALTSLLVIGPNLVSVQSYAAAGGDNDDNKIKDYKESIKKDVNSKQDTSNQNFDQDNLCYRDGDCEQANDGQQVEGKDNAASGFNDQSKNVQQQQSPVAGVSPSTPTNPPTPPPSPQTGTLLVTKNITCPDGFSCPQPSDFTMRVTGTQGNGNPSPGTFAGSVDGTTVTLNLGGYNVTEDFEDSASSPLKVVRNFSAGCSGSIEQPVKAGNAMSQTSLCKRSICF